MKTIAVIDDDVAIGNLLEELLTQAGYAVLRAYSGSEAILLLEKSLPDLILLDLMLPGLTGEEVLPQVKKVPTIVLSAKVATESKVNMLLAGAADYITKPFNTQELLARIAVCLRTQSRAPAGTLVCGDMALSTASHMLAVQGVPVHLTRTEYAILRVLMENEDTVIAKSVLLDSISADSPDCMESSLKVHVSNLRKKLRDAGSCKTVEAVWGIGFKLGAA